jgi:glutathione S-transferase
MDALPILYSFRRCPYAIRARLALAHAGITLELREVLLRNKPPDLLAASPKGTVPVLILPDGSVIEESLDIMHWALSSAGADTWQSPTCSGNMEQWLTDNDGAFKSMLDRYKYADRHPEHPADWYREQTTGFLERLDSALREHPWLHGERMGFTDAALFPFLRQFAMVDRAWFAASPYRALQRWLDSWLAHDLFVSVMHKYPPWLSGQAPVIMARHLPHGENPGGGDDAFHHAGRRDGEPRGAGVSDAIDLT